MSLARKTLLAILAGTTMLLSSCTPPAPVRIGFIGGLSGWAPDFGIDGLNGSRLAVELRNKAGGINGRQIELIEADNQQNPDMARQAVSRLIEHKVDAIIGPMTSAMAIAIVPTINRAKILMLSPSVTTNELSGQDDFFFRITPATRDSVRTSARFYFDAWGIRKIRPIYDLSNRAFTESWVKDFGLAFEAQGGQLLAPLSFTSSDKFDFSGLVKASLADNPEGIVIAANSVDTAMLCAEIRKLDNRIPLGTSEWGSTGRVIELGGKTVEGLAVEHFFDIHSKSAAYVAFRDRYIQRFRQHPGYGGLYAFDATNILLDTLAEKKPDESVKDALLSRKTYPGVQGPISFDPHGDTQGKTYIFVVRNGQFEPPAATPTSEKP